jgi:hypothetical protein
MIAALLLFAAQGDRLGLSAQQIADLGHDRFFSRYTQRHGDSTLAMNEGNLVYRDALREVNDLALSRMNERAFAVRLRKDLDAATSDVVNAGSIMTGGGTLWSLMQTSQLVVNEGAIRAVATRRYRTGATQAQVWEAIKKNEELFAASDRRVWPPETAAAQIWSGNESLAAVRHRFGALVPEIARQPAPLRRTAMGAYLDVVELFRAMEEPDEG